MGLFFIALFFLYTPLYAATPTPAVIIIHNGLINEKIDTTKDAEAQPIPKVPSGSPTPTPHYSQSSIYRRIDDKL